MCRSRAAGFTLIEMVIAIMIIGVGLAGVLTAFNTNVRSSADPLIRKQMVAAAEEMMEEILLKPFAVTGIAPANALSACGGGAPPTRAAFDDVSDYGGYQTTGICDIDGEAVNGLTDYSLSVTIDAAASLGAVGAGAVKKVSVTVTHGGDSLTLIGWRTNYAA